MMNINRIKHSLTSIIKNIPGRSFGRKIIVIECDDWGSIRMPSADTHSKLLKAGLPVNNRYELNDTLENSDDLDALFSVLRSHVDIYGNHPVMSPFCNTSNPDFSKIEACGYEEYHAETFVQTYQRYGRNDDILDVWNQGISTGLFSPEYHGREHIATELWLDSLRAGDERLRFAFKNGFVSFSPEGLPKVAKGFRPNFYLEKDNSMADIEFSLKDGIDIFQRIFGFLPAVFNAPNGVFISSLNKCLIENGIYYNAVPRKRYDRNNFGQYEYKTFTTGQKSKEGLTYYVRNANFEPSENGYKSIQHTLDQIAGAFFTGKAAIIGTHRVNFVGGINKKNRKNGLTELDSILRNILLKWPDVEFMSSRQFTSLLK